MTKAPRFHCPAVLVPGSTIDLDAGAARHVQVLRLQPGDRITLFGGHASGLEQADNAASDAPDGEFEARIVEMGRRNVRVTIESFRTASREPAREVCLAIGVPANERMDWLVEKATELGVSLIQPLMTERTVVRLEEERARKKTAHWESIAIAACEQCGRNRVPVIRPVVALASWAHPFDRLLGAETGRFLLSLHPDARPLRQVLDGQAVRGRVTILAGPEGGLSPAEELLVLGQGFESVSLGPRVLRSETAALVALTLLT